LEVSAMTGLLKRLRDRTHARADAEPASRFVPAPGVLATRAEGRTVLLDVERSRYWGLDEVGGEIWRGIEAGESTRDTVARLAMQYAAPASQIEADARGLLERLERAGLVARR
jgi:protein-disulfide isomerase-like protein with CxxC motif